ncbi:MAG: tyrosine-type recombinase/integrase, partial [Solirubrobacteraceae bacterium]
ADNIRNRVFAAAVERADELLESAGEVPLPAGLTPHKLRHTFTSLLTALGEDPGAVMDQLGHTDPAFTFRVYRHAMRRGPAERAALRALVGASTGPDPTVLGANKGTGSGFSAFIPVARRRL